MKITRISVYRSDLPYVGGEYRWGAGNVITTGRTSVVVIDTDAGLSGCGEFCPCGENYMEAHSEGVEAAARLIAPRLLGEDPRQVARIERLMDAVIRGHGYAKAPFDAACWEILGQTTGQPVWMLLGGKLTEGAPMYSVAPRRAPVEMVVNATDLHNYNTRRTGRPGPETRDGRLFASDAPGLGVEPDYESLGAPVAVFGAPR